MILDTDSRLFYTFLSIEIRSFTESVISTFCATELVQIDVFFHLPAKFQHFQAFSHMSKKPCVMIKSGENVVVPVHGATHANFQI